MCDQLWGLMGLWVANVQFSASVSGDAWGLRNSPFKANGQHLFFRNGAERFLSEPKWNPFSLARNGTKWSEMLNNSSSSIEILFSKTNVAQECLNLFTDRSFTEWCEKSKTKGALGVRINTAKHDHNEKGKTETQRKCTNLFEMLHWSQSLLKH